jgi:uncharacterized protein with HEPN domain
MSERSAKLLLEDILLSANKIVNYTAHLSFEQFISNDITIDAVIRNFEIIGEAANRLPDEIKEQFISVDWFMLRGFRNRIVHDYMGINYKIVWNIKENFLPSLTDEIKIILEKIG